MPKLQYQTELASFLVCRLDLNLVASQDCSVSQKTYYKEVEHSG